MADASRLRNELRRQGYSGKVSEEIAELYNEFNKKTRRDSVDILAEILELCRKPCLKTNIMHKANISYVSLIGFLKQLRKLKLLGFSRDTNQYQTTEKGLEFLRRYSALRELLLRSTDASPKRKSKN